MNSYLRATQTGDLPVRPKEYMRDRVKIGAITEDLDLIMARYIDFLGFGKTRTESLYTHQLIARAGREIGAWDDKMLVGMCQYVFPPEKERGVFRHGITITEQYRGGQLSRSLYDHVDKDVAEQGYGFTWGTVDPVNGPAVNAIINKAGNIGIGFRRDIYGPDEHRLLTRRTVGLPVEQIDEKDVGSRIRDGQIKIMGRHDTTGKNELAVEDNDFPNIQKAFDQGFQVAHIIRPEHCQEKRGMLYFKKATGVGFHLKYPPLEIPETIQDISLQQLKSDQDILGATLVGIENSTMEPSTFTLRMMSWSGVLLGLKDRENVVGVMGMLFNPNGQAYVYGPVLDEDHDKPELFEGLIRVSEQVARKYGSTSLNSIVPVKDESTDKGYQRASFRVGQRIIGGLDDRVDGVLYTKSLN